MRNAREHTLLQAFDFGRPDFSLASFFSFDTARFERMLCEKGENFWNRLGENRALQLFHAAAVRVPAYRDFLKKAKIDHERIRSIEDFSHVPLTTKENYISAYPLASRLWDGTLSTSYLVATSSGTSGEPKFWPRGGYQEFEAAVVHELLYRSLFGIDRHTTLMLVGFPMGIYVSGVATLLPSFLVRARGGYPLSIMSIGNNKTEMLRAISGLHRVYEQVVLVGHPFFIKDVVETAREGRISWPKKTWALMCSEGFSEEWRLYVSKKLGSGTAPRIFSTYGSSELLLMAYETPLTVAIRELSAYRKRFGDNIRTPSLFQYNPFLRYIETVAGELIFTAASGIPLVRFNLHDGGMTLSYSALRHAVGMPRVAHAWQLPFVSLTGRTDYTIVFYAANIYPDHIRMALDTPKFHKKITGKFSMRKEYLKNKDEFLEINVELRQGVRPGKRFMRQVQESIVRNLRTLNMEYLDASTRLTSKDFRPRIVLWPYRHEKYFKPGLKPRYIHTAP